MSQPAQCNLKVVEEGNSITHNMLYGFILLLLVFCFLTYRNTWGFRIGWIVLVVLTAVFAVAPLFLAAEVTSLGLSTMQKSIADGKCVAM